MTWARASGGYFATAAVSSVVAYALTSVSMTLLNKVILSGYEFRFHWYLLCFQGLIASCLQLFCRRLGWLSFRDLTVDRAKQWIPANLLFLAMLYSSFSALDRLSVPTVTVFKNTTNLIITFGDWYLFGASPSLPVLGSLLLLVFGALLAGYHDLSFDAIGYQWMAVNCLCTAAYVLFLRYSVTMKLSQSEKAFYNHVLALPLTLVLAFAAGDLPAAWSAPQFGQVGFLATMGITAAMGVLLNLASLYCIAVTGPTTYSMAGALNKIPLALLGALFFPQPFTWQSMVYIAFGLAAGSLFGIVKAQEEDTKKDIETEAVEEESAEGKGASAAVRRVPRGSDVELEHRSRYP